MNSVPILTKTTERVFKKRSSDWIEEKLIDMIISLELLPGSDIREADLIDCLHCGRTPLREALQRLAQEYLIVSIARKGMFVAELDLINYVKLIEADSLVESFSAYLAVDQCSNNEIDELEEIIASEQEAFVAADLLLVAKLDFAFHKRISEFTRNEYIVDTTTRLHRLITRYYYVALKNGLDINTSADEHQRIIKGLRRRDTEEVKNLIYLHTKEAMDRIAATMLNAGKPVFSTQKNTESPSIGSKSTIRIGVPAMMTGPGAPMGADIIASIGMAVEGINARGGVLGRKLEIVYTDIKDSNPKDSQLGAKLLDNAGVVAFFPGCFYEPACAIEFAKYSQPLLHASAIKETVDPIAANLKEYGNVIQVCASEGELGANAFINLINLPYHYPNKKVALLGSDLSYDMHVQQDFSNHAQANGWEIVLNDSYPFGSTRFDSQLARIRMEDPAVIFGCITSTDLAMKFVDQFLQKPTNSLIFLHWSPVVSKFISTLEEKANGILWQTEYGYLPTTENMLWVEKFINEFGREPGVAWLPLMDDMLNIWIKAVENANDPTDYPKVIEYIRDLRRHPYKGRAGTYGINPERNEGLSGHEWLPIHIYQVQEQKNALLFLDTKPFEGNVNFPAGKFRIPSWIKNTRTITKNKE